LLRSRRCHQVRCFCCIACSLRAGGRIHGHRSVLAWILLPQMVCWWPLQKPTCRQVCDCGLQPPAQSSKSNHM
jgi:hypothetical protein